MTARWVKYLLIAIVSLSHIFAFIANHDLVNNRPETSLLRPGSPPPSEYPPYEWNSDDLDSDSDHESSDEEFDPQSRIIPTLDYGGSFPHFDADRFGPDAGWYDSANDEEKDIVIRVINFKWYFPHTPLGLWQTAIQVRKDFRPQDAALILACHRLPTRELRRHARFLEMRTRPVLTEEEQDFHADVEEVLCRIRDDIYGANLEWLMIYALRYEGMSGKSVARVARHIMYKHDHPQAFERQMIAFYRGDQ